MLRILTLIAGLLLATAAAAQDAQGRIVVTGEGRAAAVPDMATVTLGVSARERSPGAAMERASAVAARLIERLDGLGIAPRDRQTTDLSLRPVWTNRQTGQEPPVITAYDASNRLTIRVRDLARLGDVLSAVTGEGANELAGLSFGLQDPDPVLDEARRAAIADAVARAETYAGAAGVGVGRILAISEGGDGGGPRPEMMAMARADAGGVPTEAGEAEFSARVTVVFALAD